MLEERDASSACGWWLFLVWMVFKLKRLRLRHHARASFVAHLSFCRLLFVVSFLFHLWFCCGVCCLLFLRRQSLERLLRPAWPS